MLAVSRKRRRKKEKRIQWGMKLLLLALGRKKERGREKISIDLFPYF